MRKRTVTSLAAISEHCKGLKKTPIKRGTDTMSARSVRLLGAISILFGFGLGWYGDWLHQTGPLPPEEIRLDIWCMVLGAFLVAGGWGMLWLINLRLTVPQPARVTEGAMAYDEFLFDGGTRHFALSEEDISVSGRGCNLTLLLKGLEPKYRTIRRRTTGFNIGLFFLCFGPLLAAICLSFGLEMSLAVSFAAVSSLFGLLMLVCTFREVTFALFKTTAGTDAFSIARAGPDCERFDPFVEEISQQIRKAKLESGE